MLLWDRRLQRITMQLKQRRKNKRKELPLFNKICNNYNNLLKEKKNRVFLKKINPT